MTGFVVTAPPGLEIEHAHPADGWREELDAASARWTGGPLAALATTKFGISLKAAAEPGDVVLETELLYDSGAVVRWPVPITVAARRRERFAEPRACGHRRAHRPARGGGCRGARLAAAPRRHFKRNSGSRCYGRAS